MHICISISIHSLFRYVFTINAHAYTCTCMYTCFRCAHNRHFANTVLPSFAEVKVLQQQNMLNVHHMHNLVCEVFKWNYKQHLFTHTFIPMVNRFASLYVPLNYNIIVLISHLRTPAQYELVYYTFLFIINRFQNSLPSSCVILS